jgi:hypothetical protein
MPGLTSADPMAPFTVGPGHASATAELREAATGRARRQMIRIVNVRVSRGGLTLLGKFGQGVCEISGGSGRFRHELRPAHRLRPKAQFTGGPDGGVGPGHGGRPINLRNWGLTPVSRSTIESPCRKSTTVSTKSSLADCMGPPGR